MKKRFFALLFTIAAALSVALVSCKDDDNLKAEVTLDITEVTLLVGDKVELSVKSGASNNEVRWVTSNRSVATVDEKGEVTAQGLGSATINAVTPDGRPGYCYVTVIRHVDAVVLATTYDTVIINEKLKLEYEVRPEVATNQALLWSSSDSTIATVSSDGEVTGVGLGDALIIVNSVDGSKADTNFMHVRWQPMDSVRVSIDTLHTLIMGRTRTIAAAIYPSNASNNKVTWTSTAPAIATVSDAGLVTPVAAGTVNIIVTTDEGAYADTTMVTVLAAYPTLVLGTTEWAPTNMVFRTGIANDPAERPDVSNATLYQYGRRNNGWSIPIDQTGVVCPTGWRYPTDAEFAALSLDSGTWVAANSDKGNAVAGRFFGPKNRTCNFEDLRGCVFLPASGYRNGDDGAFEAQNGTVGYYWSSTVFSNDANFRNILNFDNAGSRINIRLNTSGFNVRCVRTTP